MTQNEKIFDLLYDNGLAWEANKVPLYATLNEGTSKENVTVQTDTFGIFRSDNNDMLGTCKDRYQVFQNKELAQTIVDAAGSLNLEVKGGGALQGGRKTFLQVKLDDATVGNSGIKRNLTALNSHDGSCAIGFGTTNTVVVCTNTFHQAMRHLTKIRHTESYSTRVKSAVDSIKEAISGEGLLIDNFKRMSDTKIKDDAYVINLVSKVLNVNPNEKASTRKANQVTAMASDIRTDLNIHGDNLWGLFNGITRYTNHTAVSKDKSMDSIMAGQGARMNDIAFKQIMMQVENSLNTSILV